MASTATGELFTQEQVNLMSQDERKTLGLVRITPQEEKKLTPMSLAERSAWLKRNKATHKAARKRERQNRKAGRRG